MEDRAGGQLNRGSSPEDMEARLDFLEERGAPTEWIRRDAYPADAVRGNIENYIGTARVPLGIAGPLPVKGDHADGEFYIPLATTEGSLVASFNRGMRVVRESGGCAAKVFEDHMQRAPAFRFDSLSGAERFARWLEENRALLEESARRTTRHGRLSDVDVYNLGRNVYVRFGFFTADAAGQNMVNLASHQICRDIRDRYPHWDEVEEFKLSSKFCTDKKVSQVNVLKSRGKKVTAEVIVPEEVLAERLRATSTTIAAHTLDSSLSALYAGCPSNAFHAANGLSALFIACGQDVANVSESHLALLDVRPAGAGPGGREGLYFGVTIPSLIVGTVGGGTNLPTQRACLEILGCAGEGRALKFAEIAAAVVLAGEVSLLGAIASEEWVGAHEALGRNRPEGEGGP